MWLVLLSSDGDHLRQEGGDRAIMVRAFRRVLPRYNGPGVTVYRGCGRSNVPRRSFGLSWSTDRAVAESFARGWQRQIDAEGSVLLQAFAPRRAILGRMKGGLHDNEQEMLCDPARLLNISVLASWRHRPFVTRR